MDKISHATHSQNKAPNTEIPMSLHICINIGIVYQRPMFEAY